MKLMLFFFGTLLILLLGPMLMRFSTELDRQGDWRTASRQSAGLAPLPQAFPQAIVQVYAARAFQWRGQFAVHMWLATKPEHAKQYTVYQVIGWRMYSGLPVIDIRQDIPDRYWFGNKPSVVAELRGPEAAQAISKIEQAAKDYPYPREYTLWPGPNSNTFVAYLARSAPELKVDMPVTAIGKDYLPHGRLFARAPSGTGYQFSLFGLLGLMVARVEGVEVNLLGLSFGFNPWSPAVKVPGIGLLGWEPKESINQ